SRSRRDKRPHSCPFQSEGNRSSLGPAQTLFADRLGASRVGSSVLSVSFWRSMHGYYTAADTGRERLEYPSSRYQSFSTRFNSSSTSRTASASGDTNT